MCGIFGVVETNAPVDLALLLEATRLLSHRGPDAEGFLLGSTSTLRASVRRSSFDRETEPPRSDELGAHADIGLGFRRLAILDLDARGNQPMSDPSGRVWVVFNGEIYNYLELRNELGPRHTFRTDTDTEVLIAAYSEWGLDLAERLNGMWAFALWDMDRRRFFLSRDRVGIKPLYYTQDGSGLRFASEIKALLADPRTQRAANSSRVMDFLVSGRINHTAETLFDGVKQVLPGTQLVWDLPLNGPARESRYWSLDPHVRLNGLSDDEYASRVRDVLTDSVRIQLRSDVPIGTCLSGGIDSSSIACLVDLLLDEGVATEQIGARQRTFTSCFDDRRFDEREFAAVVIKKTEAEQHLVFPTPDDLMRDLPRVIFHQDEPIGSTSIYAQWSVFRRAAETGVKVMLDGQGGDELFAGYGEYDRYMILSLLQRGRLIHALREGSAIAPRGERAALLRWFAWATVAVWGRGYRTAIRRALGRTPAIKSKHFSPDALGDLHRPESWRERAYSDVFDERLYRELRDGLPSLLRYEDRDSMAFSIEARVPFLDHRLIELAFALPQEQKIRGGLKKDVLRRAMIGILPEEIRQRRTKLGFATPEPVWFRTHIGARVIDALADPPETIARLIDVAALRQLADRSVSEELPLGDQTVLWRVFNAIEWSGVFGLAR